MAINRIDAVVPPDSRKLQARHDTDKSQARTFELLLETATNPDSIRGANSIDPETTAEILRLQMLRTAVSSTDSDAGYRPFPTAESFSKAITIFKQQETQSAAAPAAKDEIVASEATNLSAPKAVSPDVPLAEIISRASRRYNVDAGLIKAVIKAESNFNPHAVSHAGARGLMQLMPSTARGLGVTDSFDAEQNVMAGTRFLKDMLKRYGGDLDSALAAYNWGPGNVDRHGNSLPRETREYLVKVKKYYQDFSA